MKGGLFAGNEKIFDFDSKKEVRFITTPTQVLIRNIAAELLLLSRTGQIEKLDTFVPFKQEAEEADKGPTVRFRFPHFAEKGLRGIENEILGKNPSVRILRSCLETPKMRMIELEFNELIFKIKEKK